MSIMLGKLISLILQEHFGESVCLVGSDLFSHFGKTVSLIMKSTNLRKIEVCHDSFRALYPISY